ncbi:MAG: hypothetical protein Cons2KO_32050 [Congregibacter sp.]
MLSDEPPTGPTPQRLLLPTAEVLPFFLVSFLIIATVLGGLAWAGLRYADTGGRQRVAEALQIGEARSVDAMVRQTADTLLEASSDLVLARRLIERNLDGRLSDLALNEVLVDFMQTHQTYDQVRLINNAGAEVLRINNTGSGAVLVSPEKLQDKSESYYVQVAAGMPRDSIYATRMEANQEFGVVEIPIKPVIRFLIPVYTGDARFGTAVINYRGVYLLQAIQSIGNAATGDPITINAEGRSALNEFARTAASARGEPAFSLDLPNQHSDTWRTIRATGKGSVQSVELGLLSYARFSPENALKNSALLADIEWFKPADADQAATTAWYLGSYINPQRFDAITSLAQTRTLTAELLFAALIFILAWVLALRISGLRVLSHKLQSRAMRDHLTGVLSRNEFARRLHDAVSHAQRHNRSMAMLYIDLNGFKAVNDRLGHAAGDQLLQHAASVLSRFTRSSDVVGRLGGDEFAVVLSETRSRDDTKSVMQYLKHQLATPLILGSDTIAVTASIGAANYPEDGADIETLTAHADQSMFEDKQRDRARARSADADLAAGTGNADIAL